MLSPLQALLRVYHAFLLVLLIAPPGKSQLISYEGFSEYAAGVQVESGANGSNGTGLDAGAGWGGPYNVSNAIKSLVRIENRTSSPVNYVNGEISILGGNRALRFYDIANGSYALQRPLGEVFDAAAGETLWFSFLFRTASASPLADQDFFQVGFDDSAASPNPRVSIGANTTSGSFPAPFRFFARSTTTVSNSDFYGDLDIQAAVTYLLVGRIRPNAVVYDSVSLFVNPSTLDDPGPPSASVEVPSGLTRLSHAFIRTAGLDNGDAFVLDEWHVARDYGSVVRSLRNALRILPAEEPGGPQALRWPASLGGATLETSTTLGAEPWTAVTGPFDLTGADFQHPVLTDLDIPRLFFRLRR